MTPEEYFQDIVLPTMKEFRDEPRSRRRAYLACIALFHLKDYLNKVGEKGVEERLRDATGDAFDIVRSVCNGAKHVTVNSRHVVAFSAGGDVERPPAVAGLLECGLSELGDYEGGRSVVTPGGIANLNMSLRKCALAFATIYLDHFAEIDLSDF